MISELIVLLVVASSKNGTVAPGSGVSPQWAAVVAAAREYGEAPSCGNANSLIRAIPDRPLKEWEIPDSNSAEILYEQLPIIEAQMLFGHSCSVRLAFRLRWSADAAFAQDLETALGAVATTRPELFLRELASSQIGSCDCVTALSDDLTDEERRRERTLRIERLSNSVSAELETLRRKCLRTLMRSR